MALGVITLHAHTHTHIHTHAHTHTRALVYTSLLALLCHIFTGMGVAGLWKSLEVRFAHIYAVFDPQFVKEYRC